MVPPQQGLGAHALYYAVVLQFGAAITVLLGFLPYLFFLGTSVQFWVLGLAIVFLLGMVFAAMVVGWSCGVSLIQISSGTPKIDTYINAMALVDLLIFGLLVALTGGVTDSSFVPLLLLIPVMAMVVQAGAMPAIIKTFTGIVLILVILKIPVIRNVIEALFGSYTWLLSFRGSDVRPAFEGSTILNLLATVWATYLQYIRSEA
jgi:hypothetical protein